MVGSHGGEQSDKVLFHLLLAQRRQDDLAGKIDLIFKEECAFG